jgi:hypothetical protein
MLSPLSLPLLLLSLTGILYCTPSPCILLSSQPAEICFSFLFFFLLRQCDGGDPDSRLMSCVSSSTNAVQIREEVAMTVKSKDDIISVLQEIDSTSVDGR